MNKNTVIGISLIVILYIGWGWYMSQNAPKPIPQPIAEQIQSANNGELLPELSNQDTKIASTLNDLDSVAVRNSALKEIYGNFASSASEVNTKETFIVENDKFALTMSNLGGKVDNVVLKNYYTYDSLPLVLFNSEKSNFEFGFYSDNKVLLTSSLVFEPIFYDVKPVDGVIKVSGNDSVRFGLRLYADEADGTKSSKSYIEYLYTVNGSKNMVDFDVIFNNINSVMDQNSLTMYWNSELNRQEKSLKDERTNSTVFYKYINEDGVEEMTPDKDKKEKLSTDVKWISYKDKFFVSTLIADEGFTATTIEMLNNKSISNPNYLLSMSTETRPMFSDANVIGMKWYFGANRFKDLAQYDLDLERQVPIGWGFFLMAWINKYVIINVFDWLATFGWNYGIIILLLTIGLKIVLTPLTYKTYLSGAKMRLLKPEIEELNKKYPKKDDAMKKQQATMTLYKKAGASPMSGCLPLLLQFPILIAMFRFFPSSIELRQQHFLWATDLSTYDSIWNFGFDIPFYGDHVSLFCLLMTVSMIIQTWMNSSSQPTNNNMPGMKFMMYAMPVLFMGIFNNSAAALSYYYLLTNVLTIGQMLLMRVIVDDDKVRKQIEMNKKKPVKKSAWMQRLEDMQKQQAQPQVSKSNKRK